MRKKNKQAQKDIDVEVENPDIETTETQEESAESTEKNQELEELRDKYLRLLADFENHKRRTAKERAEFMLTAAQDTMSALLPILDDFDRAKKNADDESSPEEFSEGVQMIYHKLNNTLIQKGLEPMETDGEAFDPELHEALTEIPAPTDEMKGKIIDTIEKGYRLNSRIIRHAKVVVGK